MTYTNSDEQDAESRRSRRSSRRSGRTEARGRGARKERVLHTRVSEQLSEDIRRFAEDLRVPASNLVRNVLEEVFTVVDGMTDDVGGLFDDLLDEAEGVRDRMRTGPHGRRQSRESGRSGSGRRRRQDQDVEEELRRDEASESTESAPPPKPSKPAKTAAELYPEVLGWQPLVLNRAFECGRCKRSLSAGESAFLGLGAGGLTEIALCGRCAGTR